MKKTIATGAALVAAALLVSSVGAAAPKPKLPKRWLATAVYTYTYQGDEWTAQQTVSASVVLVRVRGGTSSYEVSSGTIKYDSTQKTSDGCTQTSSGSFKASKYLLTLQLVLSRRPRASFSGSFTVRPSTSRAVEMRCTPPGTWPIVPSTSGWPAWPIRTTSRPWEA